jgi:hypothetical protein
MAFGDIELGRNDQGGDVVELQMRLAGFRGTLPDGDFGPGTELQVTTFQRDWMGLATPHGRADADTIAAISAFAAAHPLDFGQLHCSCGQCPGFGQGQFRGQYREGKPKIEAYHRFEYPGIHRMLLWSFRTALFYGGKRGWDIAVTSGYRCSESNKQQNRTSTNHHGKAIDFQIPGAAGEAEDKENSEALRSLLADTASAQIGWNAGNRKSLEPKDIAPTWVHYDVRSYASSYLDDRYFVQDLAGLDGAP